MNVAGEERVSPSWLGLREAADARARAAKLVEPILRRLRGASRLVIHDLGCGTGSMTRWLAPRLPGRQHWILCDHDLGLLERAIVGKPRTADGVPVRMETRHCDVTRLTAGDLRGADLVTASALLDMLSLEEAERIVLACVGARCPALLTLSVTGRVDLTPADPLDAEISKAFNAHQRRTAGGRHLLGPDAVGAVASAFARRGVATMVRPSPWLLGADHVDLVSAWLNGWVDAACEQRPELTVPARDYRRRRLAHAAAGRLRVAVQHQDLLAGC